MYVGVRQCVYANACTPVRVRQYVYASACAPVRVRLCLYSSALKSVHVRAFLCVRSCARLRDCVRVWPRGLFFI